MSIVANTDHRLSAEWRLVLLGLLEARDAPRVCTTPDVAQLLHQVRPRATADTLHSAIEGLVRAGALQKFSRGLYLNQRCRPAVEAAEAAAHIRRSAVVSLDTVLGECGFLNNPAAVITAVVPQRAGRVPSVGPVRTSGGLSFQFHALPPRFFAQSPAEERLLLQAGRHCAMAKPEVAALHWLHLWRSPRSSKGRPPQDVDFSVFDQDFLENLASRWGLTDALLAWQHQVRLTGDIQEPSPTAGPVTALQLQRAQDAKARLLERANTRKS